MMKNGKKRFCSILTAACLLFTVSPMNAWMEDTLPADTPIPVVTAEQTAAPTVELTIAPTVAPTIEPTAETTVEPTFEPTVEPTDAPTDEPTVEPTETPAAPEIALLQLKIQPKTITAGDMAVMTAEVQGDAQCVLFFVDGAVYPIIDFSGLKDSEIEKEKMKAAVSLKDGTAKQNVKMDLPVGEHSLTASLYYDGAWHKEGKTVYFTVSGVEATAEPTAEPATEPTAEPIAEPTIEPTAEPVTAPTIEATEEPVTEPTLEPTAEATTTPMVDQTAVPTAEPINENHTENTAVQAVGIRLSENTLLMGLLETHTLSAAFLPEGADSEQKAFSSNHMDIVSIDSETGVVTAHKVGTAVITVMSESGFSDTCAVTVQDLYPPKKIVLNDGENIVLGVGESLNIKTDIYPEDAVTTLVWRSSAEAVASVDAGTVTAHKTGTATLTVKASSGLSESVKVQVIDREKATDIKILADEQPFALGTAPILTAQVLPDTAVTTVTWTSSDEAVAQVTDGTLTLLKAGSAYITAKTANGLSDRLKITVIDLTVPTKIDIAGEKAYTLYTGDTVQLVTEIAPETAVTTLQWSANSDCVTVENGLVTAQYTGSATVTVTCENGLRDTVRIKVLDPSKVNSVKITGADTVMLGETLALTAEITPSTAETSIKWFSSNRAVATVENGVVTPVADGKITITAKADSGQYDKKIITVIDPLKASTIAIEGESERTVYIGDDITLKAILMPATALDTVLWSSAKPAVATVSDTGKVTLLRAGTATITAKTESGKKTTVKLTVIDPSLATKITLSPAEVQTVYLGDTLTLAAEVEPATAVTNIRWTTTSKYVATVEDGVVTPHQSGSVTIKAWTDNGLYAAVRVKVVNPVTAQSVQITKLQSESVNVGGQMQLSASVSPSKADKRVTWTSGNTYVAQIDSNGTLTALHAGYVTVRVKTANGKTDSVLLKITDQNGPTAVTFDTDNKILFIGNKLTPQDIGLSITPSTAQTAFFWSSSAPQNVSVTQDGVMTALTEGVSVVTVKTSNGKTASVTVQAADPEKIMDMSLNYTGEVKWRIDEAMPMLQLKITTFGGDAYPYTGDVTWTSSNRSAATVSASGELKAVNAGKTVITASAGGKKVSFTLVLYRYYPVESLSLSSRVSTNMLVGQTVQLYYTCKPTTAAAGAELVYISCDESVVTVDENGVIHAVAPGCTYVQLMDNITYVYDEILVTVSNPGKYRAILAVEATELYMYDTLGVMYSGVLQRNSDLAGMKKALTMQNFGGNKYSVTSLHNSSASAVIGAINQAAAVANVNDVTLFYFLGHGDAHGNLFFYQDNSFISPNVLKAALDRVKGRVIVMLGNCYSGTYVENGGVAPMSLDDVDVTGFNDSIMSVFAAGDQVSVMMQMDDGQIETAVSNNGELRQSKYYVLTASSSTQESVSTYFSTLDMNNHKIIVQEDRSYDRFTRGIYRAGGFDYITGGETGNRVMTLEQVYSSVNSYVHSYAGQTSDVQVYPSGCSDIIFMR